MYVCVYIQRVMGGREEGKKRQLREGKLVKILQRNLSIQFMVLPSIQVFHKFAYCEMNTFYKYTIFFFFFFFELYLIFEISAFEIHSFSRHHTQTPEVCNATCKQLSRLLTQHET